MVYSDLNIAFKITSFHFLCYVFLSLRSSDTRENPSTALRINQAKRKGAFPKVFFSIAENHFWFAKISPRLRDFLTQTKTYTGEKDYKALLWNVSNNIFNFIVKGLKLTTFESS